MVSFLMKMPFPSGCLSAYTEWLPGLWLFNSTYAVLDCEGWLPDSHGSVIISIRGPRYHSHSASKVELYVGRRAGGGAFSMDHTHFTRLGYVSLSENEQTGFRVSRNGCESNSYRNPSPSLVPRLFLISSFLLRVERGNEPGDEATQPHGKKFLFP